MNKVLQDIESNLSSDIDINKLSKIACYSEFHFHRLFRAYVGESIYGYRKRLLLERAVKQLLYSNESITEISFECGYDNQSSFNKSFKNHFSYTPSQVRKQRVSITSGKFKPDIQRNIKVKPTIKDIEDINIICAREVGSYEVAAPKAWGRIMSFVYSNKLMTKETRSIGISYDDPNLTNSDYIRYDACLDIKTNIASEDNLIRKPISGGKYAVFLHKGCYENFKQTYSYIFNDWLTESEHDLCNERNCFEIYLNRDPRRTKPENLRTELCIPIN